MNQFNPANHPAIEIAAELARIAAGTPAPSLTTLTYGPNGFSETSISALEFLEQQL